MEIVESANKCRNLLWFFLIPKKKHLYNQLLYIYKVITRIRLYIYDKQN